LEYNPFTRETQTNPYPVYKWLRDEAPVYHNPHVGFWALSRFDDVLSAHLDHGTFISKYGPTIEKFDGSMDTLIASDPPDHTWQRKLVSRLFTPRAISDLEPKVRAIASEILDEASERGEIDVVPEFSGHLPMMVIAEMLGLPLEPRTRLRELSDRMLDRSDATEDGTVSDASTDAIAEAYVVLGEIVAEKEKHPGDDVATLLLTGTVPDHDGVERRLNRDQVVARLLELVAAGHETTAKLIANGVVALSWYPEQRAELVADPSLVPQAVEEMLRWDPPSHYQGRWIERDVTMHGVTIPAESRVILITGSANHDERLFEEPELFDIHRNIDRHVAFGFGIHLCVGAALARLESRIAFEELLTRFPNYELGSPIHRAYSSNVRGLSNLPISLVS
jgi:cytochrome P450